MKFHGETAPEGQDGYVPGFWDKVRQEYMDGNITERAYERLRQASGDVKQ